MEARLKQVSTALRSTTLAILLYATLTSSAASKWVDFGVLQDGTIYQWNPDLVIRMPRYFSVSTRATYGRPHPIGGKMAYSTEADYEIYCKTGEIELAVGTYYDADHKDIGGGVGWGKLHPKETTVEGRLLKTVCDAVRN